MRSLSSKLSLLTSLFVLGVIAVMAQRILTATEQSLLAEMRVRAEFFARSSREGLFPKVDPFALHFHVSELLKEKAVVYAAVMDGDGVFLSHSTPSRIGEKGADPLSVRALASESPLLQRITDPKGAEAYDLSAPVVVAAKRVGTVRIGFSRASVDEALREPKRQLLVIAAAAVLASILGTVLIVGWLTRPLPLLANAAREAGRGNFDVQIEWKSRDEIGTLARAFNEMTTANALLFTAIREEKEKLATVFQETREGIVWTRADGRILLINRAASFMLDCRDRSLADLSSALTGFEVKPELKAVFASSSRAIPCEFARQKPKPLVLAGIAGRLGSDEDPAGYLFVFHDATIEKREETLARNFLSIVSHKLRTPLAVALGYAEMMQNDAKSLNAFHAQALGKIAGENEKLRSLVEKLLLFTTVQSPDAIKLVRVTTGIATVAAAAVKSMKGLLEKNSVAFKWDPEALATLPPLQLDAQMIEEAIKNLIDNAVKFNRSAKKEVALSAALLGSEVRVSVTDNGPGIPSEEHPKLFKKFYQVDQDFTGQIPGMGLGLAFVRNVAEAHGGKAGLTSPPGGGCEFYFTLPVSAEG
ncbi:MAG: HAMP domain-containing protein [Elusimicrobia bacterium]|nr:HAMP domain-containing protein [Elusimicrobiota bacterium]